MTTIAPEDKSKDKSKDKPKNLSKIMSNNINNLFRPLGYRFSKIKPIQPDEHFVRRQKLLETYNINVLFDVGANIGQYSKEMRTKINYEGQIISFEPMSSEFAKLRKTAQDDPMWKVENIALGNEIGEGEIQISGNSVSSSMLDMLPSVIEACTDEAAYIGKESIEIQTVDAIFDKYCTTTDNVFLKIDTQGYEHAVLEGAINSLPKISGLQLELSLTPFYKGEVLYLEMLEYVTSLGFTLMSIEPVLENTNTGRQLQVDGIFYRE